MTNHQTTMAGTAEGGFVMDVALRVVLLLLVVGQVVFLASRYRTRVDLTADGVYTFTESTAKVLAGLDDRLLIEEYFSDESQLPTQFREYRRDMENLLDEYVQLSDGKIVVQKLNPQEDNMVKEKAQRLGMRPVTLSDPGDSSLSFKEIWQGVRLMYGADKQEVIPFLNFYTATAGFEAAVTPKIKALAVKEKTVIGVLAFPTEASPGQPGMPPQFGGGSQPKGFQQLARLPVLAQRYDVQTVNLSEGQLVPDDISVMLLIRPKNLTDRQKYAIDQFLMRGGNLVVFADTAEFEIGQGRTFRSRRVSYDAPDSELKFLDQLAHYGAKVEQKLVGDALPDAQSTEQFRILRRTAFGTMAVPLRYPYWFHAIDVDYASLAERFVVDNGGNGGNGDPLALVERYRNTFKPGLSHTNEMGRVSKRGGPGMFWPCPVGLEPTLPEGVTGEILLRSSPFSFVEDPPPDLNPTGFDRQNPGAVNASIRSFDMRIQQKIMSEPRQQFGLMVQLRGAFGSFFDGKEIPPRVKEEEPATADEAAPDPLDAPIGETPAKTGEAAEPDATESKAAEAETAEAETAEAETAEAETAEEESGQEESAEEETAEPETVAAQEPEGPPAPDAGESKEQEDEEPEPIMRADSAQLIVIGDSDFVRDDLLTGEYQQQGGPVSETGELFLGNLIDWLAEDQDLLALRKKVIEPRPIRFVEDDPAADRAEIAAAVNATTNAVRWVNLVVPVGAMLMIWLLTGLQRRRRKQSFVASVEAQAR